MGTGEMMEVLKAIREDGKKWLAAPDVIVYWDGEGYTMEVDGEEYGWYKNMKEIVPDIKEFAEERVWAKSKYSEEVMW